MLEHVPGEVLGLAVGLGAGLVIGVEREQHKAEHAERMAAGVRTCALVALCGGVAWILGPVALAIAGGFIALATVTSYWGTQQTDPGLTSEVVLVLTFLIGVLAMTQPALAAGVAVVAAILLQAKSWLHTFSRQVLTESELNDALLLLASALVVLPILPDTPIAPFEGLNLRRLWALVVLVMAINAAGYIAIRAIGPRLGLPLTGLVGGLVSSSATIAGMGHRARANPALARACAAGGMASNLSTVALFALIFAAADRTLLVALALPLGLAGAAVLVASAWLGARALRDPVQDGAVVATRPFHFGHALAFAAMIAGVLAAATLMGRWLGEAGITITAAVAGFADTHAAAVSVAELSAGGAIPTAQAVLAVLLAFSANTVTKIVLAITAGGGDYARRVVPGLLAMMAGAWLGWFVG
ncbi:MAG: MgtC/SapB family protein [Xanthomonadaceae bacterium]|jgi:uncharacterized membrane protein (DUF4010 family)|nr:MgtC/SapB family protein [Xanthomonadaceae bacterium]